jgi:hypothetical protein
LESASAFLFDDLRVAHHFGIGKDDAVPSDTTCSSTKLLYGDHTNVRARAKPKACSTVGSKSRAAIRKA